MNELGVKKIDYSDRIKRRSKLKFLIGLIVRIKKYIWFGAIRSIARYKGAKIGKNVIIPFNLALKANSNLQIDNDSIIETSNIDLRGKVSIGKNVILNKSVIIIRASHDVNCEYYSTTISDLTIQSYAWICTGSVILPNVKIIEEGAIIGAYAVCADRIVELNSILVGNPAKVIKKRNQIHSRLVTSSLKGGDLVYYWSAYINKL